LALRCGRRPAFFRETISWEPYVAGLTSTKSAGIATVDKIQISACIDSLDRRLVTVWEDLRHFSSISNLARQTGYRFPKSTFSEIMISILYRLLHLSLEESIIEEALRVAMIAFCAKIFCRWQVTRRRPDHFSDLFSNTLTKLKSRSDEVPPALVFWLLMIWSVSVLTTPSINPHAVWLRQTTEVLSISSWDEARVLLKSMIWIESLCDLQGQLIFDEMMRRLPTTSLIQQPTISKDSN
jgi:hypothetical protein